MGPGGRHTGYFSSSIGLIVPFHGQWAVAAPEKVRDDPVRLYPRERRDAPTAGPAEGEVLVQIAKAWKRGKSYTRIADDLNADRIPTKGGGRWCNR